MAATHDLCALIAYFSITNNLNSASASNARFAGAHSTFLFANALLEISVMEFYSQKSLKSFNNAIITIIS